MFCYNRAPSPFFDLRWNLVKAALAFDNLRLGKDRVDRAAIEKVVARLRHFSENTSKFKDPPWVVYYADVFLVDKNRNISVDELQKLVREKADEMMNALDDSSSYVPMRKFCLQMHEEACRR
jgi:hypothetical protein